MAETFAPGPTHDRAGRALLIAGLLAPASGVALFFGLMASGRLDVPPYYLPALALLGVPLIAWSLLRHRTAIRWAALAGVLALAGLEAGFLVAVGLPEYSGPIAVGRPFPSFETKRADGSRFTRDDLVGSQTTALVFFRGRW